MFVLQSNFEKSLKASKMEHDEDQRSQWSSSNTLACGARGPMIELRCRQKVCVLRDKLLHT